MEEEKKNDSKIEEKHMPKVTTGAIRTKKKSKFQELFVQEDLRAAARYAFEEMAVPGLKNVIFDVFTSAIKRMMWGESSDRRERRGSPKISYQRYYDDHDDYRSNRSRSDRRDRDRDSKYGYDEILFETREDADEVLDNLLNALAEGYIVSVGDYYDFCGKTGSYTDHKYGWTDLRSAKVERYGKEYYIKLPPALPLN